jgi:hypothetical protein
MTRFRKAAFGNPLPNIITHEYFELNCSIPDDHISPRRSALFMARSVLRDIRDGK